MTNNNWYTIRAIVEQCMIDLGVESSLPRKAQYMSWAVMGYRQLNLNAIKQVKKGKFPVSELKTVDLPPDYVGYSKIGFQSGDKIIQFSSNDNIATVFSLDEDGNEVPNSYKQDTFLLNGINTTSYLANNFMTGYDGGMIPVRSFFRVDLATNRIIFSVPMALKEIYMEYITDGLDCIEETLVPPTAYEVIRRYVHLQRANNSRNEPLSEKRYQSMLYSNALLSYQQNSYDANVQTIIDTANQFYALGAKK